MLVGKIDPATKVFQAIRIAVNNELGELDSVLESVPSIFHVGSKVCFISYHSGEDERVKRAFTTWTKGNCRCPAELACVCGAQVIAKTVVRMGRPKDDEMSVNPRSRSAKLRAIEMIDPVTVAVLRGRTQ